MRIGLVSATILVYQFVHSRTWAFVSTSHLYANTRKIHCNIHTYNHPIRTQYLSTSADGFAMKISTKLVSPLHSSSSSSSSESAASASTSSESSTSTSSQAPKSLYLHHTAIKTRNIETAIKFYSLFGFEIEHKFRAGPARAAWLTNSYFSDDHDDIDNNENESESKSESKSENKKATIKGQNDVASRIELIEVPAYMLNEQENTIKKAIDLVQNESLLGLNHYALDVTSYIRYLEQSNLLTSDDDDDLSSSSYGLQEFLKYIEARSLKKFNKTLRIAVQPRQQVLGNQVYELAFLYDADGTIVELVRYIKEVQLKVGQTMDSGWDPWDGSGFVGKEQGEDECYR